MKERKSLSQWGNIRRSRLEQDAEGSSFELKTGSKEGTESREIH